MMNVPKHSIEFNASGAGYRAKLCLDSIACCLNLELKYSRISANP